MDKIIGFHLGIWGSLSPKIGRAPNQVSTWWGALLAEREGNVPFPFISLYHRCLSNPVNR